MIDLLLVGLILIMIIGFLVLDQRQYETRLKQSYDEGFRDGLSTFAKDAKVTVAERQELLGNEKD